eukprot:CAMPEP_0197437000 /NCGR_PEP_ID=MMETSP1175-20131217/4317_1 /TAXON_ID=1003142 /ORGANISM="Triceratium dubium, Strain CCMP147" /LENGTH=566 /DNA_ID=CAMNT_0042966411 /DNA_START=354 /DNA_END=2054 /DNA_ORIENTATION=+
MDDDVNSDLFVIDDEEDDDTGASVRNVSFRTSGECKPRSLDEFFEEAYASSNVRDRMKYWLVYVALGIGNMGDSTELTSVGYLMANEDFQESILHDDFATDGSVVASCALAGMVIGGLMAGAFEDSLGRKRTLLGGLLLNAISCVLSAFSPSVAVLSLFRFFVGIGIGAILSSNTALAAELSPPSKRGLFVTVVSGFWSVGMLFTAAVANVVMGSMGLSWRIFIVVTAVPTIFCIVMVLLVVPDSPRFLALHGQFNEAVRCSNQVAEMLGHQGTKLSVDEVQCHFPLRGMRGSNKTEKGECDAVESSASSPVETERTSSCREAAGNISALYCKTLRNTTLSLQLLWIFLEMGTGLGSFINLVFEEIGKGEYIGSSLAAIGNLIGSVLGAVYLDKFGRKSTISFSMILSSMAIAYSAWIVNGDEHPMLPLILSTTLFSGLASLAWNANMTLSAELFPTKVRSTGLGYVAATGRIACIVQQFINGALIDRPAILLVVASGLLLVGASTMLCLRTNDMARQPLSDAVSGRETKVGGNRGDFTMVPLDKESGEPKHATQVDISEELPSLV